MIPFHNSTRNDGTSAALSASNGTAEKAMEMLGYIYIYIAIDLHT